MEDKRDYWRTSAEAPVRWPLEAVSDEALTRLQRRATGELMRAQANTAQNPAAPAPDKRDLARTWLAETN